MEVDGKELRRLADELAIRRLVAQYADAVTRNDGRAWIETWTEDGRWALGGSSSQGHAKLLETWRSLMALFETVVQLPQNGIVDLAGDEATEATGRWVVLELGRAKGGSPSLTVGSYSDLYRRVGASWRFSRRQLDFIYSGPPDLGGQWFS